MKVDCHSWKSDRLITFQDFEMVDYHAWESDCLLLSRALRSVEPLPGVLGSPRAWCLEY